MPDASTLQQRYNALRPCPQKWVDAAMKSREQAMHKLGMDTIWAAERQWVWQEVIREAETMTDGQALEAIHELKPQKFKAHAPGWNSPLTLAVPVL